MALDENRLEELMERLEKARPWSARVVSRIEHLVRNGDDAAVFRVNPRAFAAARGMDESEAIDLFLHATKVGLFQMNWHLLCPQCAEVVESFTALRNVRASYRCELCHIDHTTALDDFIEVTFTVTPSVRRIRYHDPASLDAEDYFLFYRHAPGGLAPGGVPFVEYLRQARSAGVMAILEPGATVENEIDLLHGGITGYAPIQRGEMFVLVEGDPRSDQVLVAEVDRDGLRTSHERVAPGRCLLRVHNRSAERAPILVLPVPATFMERRVLEFVPFLSGKSLINKQTFRDLFRGETVRGAEGLAVKDLTLLFTDLKGSTSLYERIGDLKAFTLVQEHFDRLARVIERHEGAIVKTIGDAVMAAFERSSDAVSAALLMLTEIERFNHEHGARDIILKIGIHRGASIAVTLNDRLDYFGQTVNIAARVQGLADAEEIYLTEDVFRSPGVAPLLAAHHLEPEDARLRGIQKEVRVYRLRAGARPTA